jgi:hypothetical protein
LTKIKETRLPLAAAQEQRGRPDQAEVDPSRAVGSLIVKSAPSAQLSAEIRQCWALTMMQPFVR